MGSIPGTTKTKQKIQGPHRGAGGPDRQGRAVESPVPGTSCLVFLRSLQVQPQGQPGAFPGCFCILFELVTSLMTTGFPFSWSCCPAPARGSTCGSSAFVMSSLHVTVLFQSWQLLRRNDPIRRCLGKAEQKTYTALSQQNEERGPDYLPRAPALSSSPAHPRGCGPGTAASELPTSAGSQ